MTQFNNITVIIVCVTIIAILCLIRGYENVLTAIVGGLIGFLAKDQVMLERVVDKTEETDGVVLDEQS